MARNSALDSMSIADLKGLILKRRFRLSALKKERAKLLKRLEQLDKDIGSASSSGRRGSRPRNEMTLPDAIEAALKSGKHMGVPEIAEAVRAAGYKSNAAKFNAVVNLALIKDKKRFAKIERGVYALKR